MRVYGRSVVPNALGVTTADHRGRDSTEDESMSHITKTAEVKPITSVESYGRAITVSLALTAAIRRFITSGAWDTFYTTNRLPEERRAASRPDPNQLDECE